MSMTGVGWEFEVLQLRPVIKSCVLEWMQISKKKGTRFAYRVTDRDIPGKLLSLDPALQIPADGRRCENLCRLSPMSLARSHERAYYYVSYIIESYVECHSVENPADGPIHEMIFSCLARVMRNPLGLLVTLPDPLLTPLLLCGLSEGAARVRVGRTHT